jgi:C_GCAxxG_C_C family probable redox protein
MFRFLRRKKILASEAASAGEKAGQLFDAGYNCTQSVLQATCPQAGNDLVTMAEAFGGGIGNSKCLCGAVTGGVMALGLQGKGGHSGALVTAFRADNRTTCCKALSAPYIWLSKEHQANCRRLTVATAEEVARLLQK